MTLENIAKKIRANIIGSLKPKESHHIGCSLSIVEILTYLYFSELKIYPKDPKNPKRDIFILSKGHAALALYSTLHERGFISSAQLSTYDADGSFFAEHATTEVSGVELSSGSLGHGLAVGNGFATSFLNDGRTNRVFVLLSDGELNEGSTWEALMYAGHHRLSNLTAIIDLNGFQGYSATNKVIDLSPLSRKIALFNWNVYEANGHDFNDLERVFTLVRKSKNGKPNCIVAETVKGKGVPLFEGKFEAHYLAITEEQKKEILKNLRGDLAF